MAVITARQLLDAGVHFGHQTRRWNPKMRRFIFTERNGIYIIDLHKSIQEIETAYLFVRNLVANGGQILFVGTKKQAQETIAEQSTRVGMPYVNQRWLGGMLTNFPTMMKRIQRLKELEAMDLSNVSASGLTKKELLGLSRERDKLNRSLGGIRDMGKVPAAVWIVDTNKEHLAVDEARKLGIPIVAILDTNCDPDEVNYPIPGNDDAIRAVALLTKVIADAVADGLMARSHAPMTGEEEVEVEPMPEWERELLSGAETEAAADPAEVVEVVEPVAVEVTEVPEIEVAATVEVTEPEVVEVVDVAAVAEPVVVEVAEVVETPEVAEVVETVEVAEAVQTPEPTEEPAKKTRTRRTPKA
ncbi:MAG: 30S ribosomal protein S2 [Propionibacteriaceae bacterium]|nr:30S ribosomal protein S2 [Propionibacteriaceae bacterium]